MHEIKEERLTNGFAPLNPMDHVMKENHIDWEGVKFPARDTDWTARGVKEAVEIRNPGANAMNRDRGHHQLPSLYSKLQVKRMSPFVTNGAVSTDDVDSHCLAKLVCRYLTSNVMS